jgi:hypothetical protein
MDKDIIALINSINMDNANYSIAKKQLDNILLHGKLSKSDICEIFALQNNIIIADFLKEYQYFSRNDIKFINEYIIKNLNNQDRLFVSDLIEFAIDWDLDLPYEECLSFLNKYEEDNHYVLLVTIEYIFKNLKFSYIDSIIDSLNKIVDNPNQLQPAQVLASFVLFRITQKKEYLINLVDLVVNYGHQELLYNLLQETYNDQKYFDYHDFLITISRVNG